MSTEAENFFKMARELNEGEYTTKHFSTPAQANSFRVRLYRVRNTLGDYTVEISISGAKVTLTKTKAENEYSVFDKDGNEIEKKVINVSLLQKLEEFQNVQEILKSKGFSKEREEMILDCEYERIFGAQRENESFSTEEEGSTTCQQ